MGNLVDKFLVSLRFVIRTFGKLRVEAFDVALHFVDMVESQFRLFADRARILQLHLLGQIADRNILGNADAASRRRLQAGENLEEGRFARPVFSYQRDAVFFVYHERNVVEKGETTELYRQSIYS